MQSPADICPDVTRKVDGVLNASYLLPPAHIYLRHTFHLALIAGGVVVMEVARMLTLRMWWWSPMATLRRCWSMMEWS